MIEELYVNNYKCLVDVRIPLTPIHVIIGQNDSGKTSLLEAMLALSRSTERALLEAFPGDWQGRELVFVGAEKPVIQFEARFGAVEGDVHSPISYRLEVQFNVQGRACNGIEERYSDVKGESHPIPQVEAGWTGVACRFRLSSGAEQVRLTSIARRFEITTLYRFDPQIMALPTVLDPLRRFRVYPDGFGLATLLDDISGYDPERFLALSRDLCNYFPQFRRVRIETQQAVSRIVDHTGNYSSGTGVGKGIVLETSEGRAIRLRQASDGAILFLGLLALIYSPEPPKLLLIEEPEKGVYPKRLEEVVRLIRRLHEAPSGRATPQIIMTTHSPYLLTSFHPDEVTLMARRNGSGPVLARPLRDAPNIEERLGQGEFYLGELWYNLSEEELFADV